MKKYAMMVMGNYDTAKDTAEFIHGDMLTRFVTVRDMEEAKETAKRLLDEGFGFLELCGAFGKENARMLAEETGGRMAIGYCVNDPDMDQTIAEFFR